MVGKRLHETKRGDVPCKHKLFLHNQVIKVCLKLTCLQGKAVFLLTDFFLSLFCNFFKKVIRCLDKIVSTQKSA